jgi:predicted tellurium resistance membrane protein TerC
MMELLTSPEAWISFATLFALELVLGIDNIVFISILCGKLPAEQRSKARIMGLSLAVITRVLLLLSLAWIMSLTQPFFEVLGRGVSGRDLILLVGGLFLLGKSTFEIHHKLEVDDGYQDKSITSSMARVIFQILLLDIVFSLDSVITAVGMVDNKVIMIAAILASTAVMIVASKTISDFVDDHPTIKMLALSFLILIGVTLIADGLGHHIPKGYIYFSMAFSLAVELLNLKMRKNQKKVKLHEPYSDKN